MNLLAWMHHLFRSIVRAPIESELGRSRPPLRYQHEQPSPVQVFVDTKLVKRAILSIEQTFYSSQLKFEWKIPPSESMLNYEFMQMKHL